MLVVAQRNMFPTQILVLVVVLVRTQIKAEKIDTTGELSSSSGGTILNVIKFRIKNEQDEEDSNIQPMYSPEEYNKFMKEFKDEDTKEKIQYHKLKNIQKTTEKENLLSKNHENKNSQENSGNSYNEFYWDLHLDNTGVAVLRL
jgi:hypothetical protein